MTALVQNKGFVESHCLPPHLAGNGTKNSFQQSPEDKSGYEAFSVHMYSIFILKHIVVSTGYQLLLWGKCRFALAEDGEHEDFVLMCRSEHHKVCLVYLLLRCNPEAALVVGTS